MAELRVGVYRVDSTVYRVYPAHINSTRLLAKKFIPPTADTKAHWQLVGTAGNFVIAQERMTKAQVVKFGVQFGICCVCGAALRDQLAKKRGIDSTCAKKTEYYT